jgi:hypothetical protein
MPIEHLDKAHLDHVTDEQGHIVDPLRDDHQFVLPGIRLTRDTVLPQ